MVRVNRALLPAPRSTNRSWAIRTSPRMLQSARVSMRIAYCTNVRLPSERAHGHQIAQVADAWVRLGHRVELFGPIRDNPIRQDFADYYRVDPSIRVTSVGRFDAIGARWLPDLVGLWMTNAGLRWFYRKKLRAGDWLVCQAQNSVRSSAGCRDKRSSRGVAPPPVTDPRMCH